MPAGDLARCDAGHTRKKPLPIGAKENPAGSEPAGLRLSALIQTQIDRHAMLRRIAANVASRHFPISQGQHRNADIDTYGHEAGGPSDLHLGPQAAPIRYGVPLASD